MVTLCLKINFFLSKLLFFCRLALCLICRLLHFAVQSSPPQILTCLVHDDAAEEEQGEQVRDCHERIHAVSDVPNQFQRDHTADKYTDNI